MGGAGGTGAGASLHFVTRRPSLSPHMVSKRRAALEARKSKFVDDILIPESESSSDDDKAKGTLAPRPRLPCFPIGARRCRRRARL